MEGAQQIHGRCFNMGFPHARKGTLQDSKMSETPLPKNIASKQEMVRRQNDQHEM